MTEEALLHAALALTDPNERAAFLAHACAGQPKLRAAVEARLAAHLSAPAPAEPETAASPPVRPAPEATAAYTPPEIRPGAVIAGRYQLLHRLGEGGMGEVWVAKQEEPVKRKVALKLIKAGMDSRAVVARFEQERQALALMDHPNIARVLDGGLTEQRRPYFVMELVNGTPLTRFCDEQRLSIRGRLELFVPICQAVQHAHQKGIVHRDLKPSNILVSFGDGKPIARVIDFGLAKATGGKLTDESLSTEFGAVLGTLDYMAPEQAGLTAQDVDTRADIYSLGVILYELLTGLRPFDRLRQTEFYEAIRLLREEAPPRPSTRLATNESLPSLASVRQTEPRKLTSLLRGELDWVVMKCLEKERGRRYETVNGLTRDVERYLANEPVEACPPSARYRLGKLVRRNQGKVLAGALLLLALVAGIVGTSWGLWRAQRRLAQIEKATDLLATIFEELDPRAEEKEGKALRLLLGERLEQAARQLEGEAIADPLTVARLQNILGESLRSLGHAVPAVELLEKAARTRQALLGDDHPDTLTCRNNLALAYKAADKLDQAIALSARWRVWKRSWATTMPKRSIRATTWRTLTGRPAI
jgi:non-specific serine/threonine protein kinase/serine/threonine-protein kinase